MDSPHDDALAYGLIAEELKGGRVIPFLGAGVCKVGRGEDEKWVKGKGLPTGGELAIELAGQVGYPGEPTRLESVAQYAYQAQKKPFFKRILRETLAMDGGPTALHKVLAKVVQTRLYVTTNYDTLLERALRAEGVEPVCVFHAPHNGQGPNYFGWKESEKGYPKYRKDDEITRTDIQNRRVVFKMHGTLADDPTQNWDDFVITEDDYTEYLAQMPVPTAFFPQFVKCSFLFLGCSLDDPDLRVLLHRLEKHKKEVPSWCIRISASDGEKKIWEERKVTIYNVQINRFVAALSSKLGLDGGSKDAGEAVQGS